MFFRAWAAACGLLLIHDIGAAYAQAPTVDAMPAGAGLPGGKPADIRGLHTGMPANTAVAALQQHYKTQKGVQLVVREKSLAQGGKTFPAYATNSPSGGNDNYDLLGAAFTSDASGNEVVSIISDAGYARGNQPSAPETIAAIKKKYGEPSSTQATDFEVRMVYGFKDGKVMTTDGACAGLTRLGALTLRQPDLLLADSWYRAMADGAVSNTAANMPRETNHCDAALFVSIAYGVSVGADRNLTPNKNTIGQMRIVFFDAKRFQAAVERDAAAVKDLQNKNLQNAPAGKGPAKL